MSKAVFIGPATFLLLLGLHGCVGAAATPSAPSLTAPTSLDTRDERPGLMVDRWRLPEDGPRLDALLSAVSSNDSVLIPGAEAMQRDGFRVILLDGDQLEVLEKALGANSFAGRTWHGEAVGWRNIASRRLGGGTVVLLNGRARRVGNQVLAIGIRGYSIPTLDDAALQIEFAPYIVRKTLDPLGERSLGELRGEPLSQSIEWTLEPGQAMVIASIPHLRSHPDTGLGDDRDSDQNANQRNSEATTSAPPITPPTGTGPNAPLPLTPAEILLDDAGVRTRGLIVITGRPHPSLGIPEKDN
ncbi:MAG: hypothetical protein O3A19_06835 [Planctomycetota bacterium]|jgi:hypothetical protein|nr:hypothetical protein [Planctomycetota bacterium]MDA1026128.1 hypothetical protein [Planctomycetota bacterium]